MCSCVLDRCAYSQARSGALRRYKAMGEGVQELLIDHGPGYRVYFAQRGPIVILLLGAGDKRTQSANINIKRAIEIANTWHAEKEGTQD